MKKITSKTMLTFTKPSPARNQNVTFSRYGSFGANAHPGGTPMQVIQQTTRPSTQTNFTILAVGLIVLTGVIHLFNANEAMGDATYKGALFIANGLGAIIAAIGISKHEKSWGWNLAALIAAGSSLAYIASRTIGLPGLPAEPDAWLEPLGFASLLAELAFVGMFIAWMRHETSKSMPKLQS
jgi:hypothetical protein